MSNYYDYREVKVMIAHKLMSMEGWKVNGYHEDRSDSMTDYYDPASWGLLLGLAGFLAIIKLFTFLSVRKQAKNVTKKWR